MFLDIKNTVYYNTAVQEHDSTKIRQYSGVCGLTKSIMIMLMTTTMIDTEYDRHPTLNWTACSRRTLPLNNRLGTWMVQHGWTILVNYIVLRLTMHTASHGWEVVLTVGKREKSSVQMVVDRLRLVSVKYIASTHGHMSLFGRCLKNGNHRSTRLKQPGATGVVSIDVTSN